MNKQGLKDLMLFAKQRGIKSVEEAVMCFYALQNTAW